ncbi:hypothetical protein J6590_015830 [Homalodisca vitripennis]|nr:hypothetical protein J6590_015830 [Homalodisca vitripennis]
MSSIHGRSIEITEKKIQEVHANKLFTARSHVPKLEIMSKKLEFVRSRRNMLGRQVASDVSGESLMGITLDYVLALRHCQTRSAQHRIQGYEALPSELSLELRVENRKPLFKRKLRRLLVQGAYYSVGEFADREDYVINQFCWVGGATTCSFSN